jgi:hypothetical protein
MSISPNDGVLIIRQAMSTQGYPLSDLLSRSISFIHRESPRKASSLAKSEKLLCLEYLLLQECILEGLLSLLSSNPSQPLPPSYIEAEHLDTPEIWRQFCVVEPGLAGSTSPAGNISDPGATISALDLHQRTGSPVPPSLLRLFLQNILMILKIQERSANRSLTVDVGKLEEDVCGWRPGVHEADHGVAQTTGERGDSSGSETSSEADSDTRGSEVDPRIIATRPGLISSLLTTAYHTTLLLVFFSFTRPSSAFLVRPLQEELLDQLEDYVDAVEKAAVNVGIGNGIRWPMQVLQILNPSKRYGRRIRSLLVYINNRE